MKFTRIEGAPISDSARAAVVRSAAERLAGGGILVHPTNGLYGLGARATDELDREILRLKGADPSRPLIRLAPDPETVRTRLPGSAEDERYQLLVTAFWPGSLTLVLRHGEGGVAVRVDGHPLLRAVLRRFGDLMSSTSVNRSGRPAAVTPDAVRYELHRMPDARTPVSFLDAGAVRGEPSTVVSLLEPTARLLRAGAVPVERVEAVLGAEVAR